MKRLFLILALICSVTTASAQVKDHGVKFIGALGSSVSWVHELKIGYEGTSFGAFAPLADVSVGGMVNSNLFLGAGVGYNAVFFAGSYKKYAAAHEGKVFVHGRYYFTPSYGQTVLFDCKFGYNRAFSDTQSALGLFFGPGYLFADRYAVSVGYSGSFYKDGGIHGVAAQFSVEF